MFLGQAYRLDSGDNPFPEGSGLSEQSSDVVGQVSASVTDRYLLNYRFQLDNESLSSQRHEFDAYAAWGRTEWDTRYLFSKALEGTDITESREQIENVLGYKLTKGWRMRAGAVHDLGIDPGMRRASLELDYHGCCLFFSASARRNLTRDSSGDSGTNIMLRLGLKGIGNSETSEDRPLYDFMR